MSKGFYSRIAKDNIKKNAKSYIPYILASIGTIAMFYIMFALGMNTNLKKLPGFDMVVLLMRFGNVIIGVFAAIFLFYTNSFLMKRRKKEFGLFNILGMEKRHITKVLFLETIYVSAFSIAGGLLVGVILYKMMFLVLLRILDFEVVLGFEICVPGIFSTLALFVLIYLIILFHNFREIHLSNPIELLHGSQVGEKEPKTKWIIALLGFICLGTGYYIANTVKTSMEAVSLFFVAVLLVVIGTYCLFIAGSILVLKILRKNKKFYYHPKHFVSVSGMIYRMRQNAVGLANICVLSTMVLVMVSTTVSLYVGLDDALKSRYEKGVNTVVQELDYEDVPIFLEKAEKELDAAGIERNNLEEYRYLITSAEVIGNRISATHQNMHARDIAMITFLDVRDYEKLTKKDVELGENELYMYALRGTQIMEDEVKIQDETWKIKKHLEECPVPGKVTSILGDVYILVMNGQDAVRLADSMNDIIEINSFNYFYGFDTKRGTLEEEEKAMQVIGNLGKDEDYNLYCEGREENRQSFYSMYGGFLFLGILLGTVFMMAAVLIIYYKQISEGYEDAGRFEIMQKVGMSKHEVRQSIKSQVLMVFFLPVILAGIHVAAAFNIIKQLMAMLNLSNTKLFMTGTAVTMLVFVIVYAIVYGLTAREYYKIVEKKG